MVAELQPRWLTAEKTADYVGCRVDALRRLVKAGKLPKPSLHLGPRSPRWDRLAIDGMFAGSARSDADAAFEAIAAQIRARKL